MSRGFRDADETQVINEQSTVDAIQNVLRTNRRQEARSEARRADGSHQVCEDCGRPIGAERLKALPTATRCIGCQAASEQTRS